MRKLVQVTQHRSVNLSKQKGVALIQVLLIVSMILILVVQLSKGSKEQVDTAIRLKDKNNVLIAMDSALELIKFNLLTQQKNKRFNTPISSQWNFYGSTFFYMGVDISLQDSAGLISLPYYADYLDKLTEYSNIQQTIENLKLWQGVADSGRIPDSFRGATMQYGSEVLQVPGWIGADVPLGLTTYLPTYYFNPNTAPDELLTAIAKDGDAELLLQTRASGEMSLADFNSMSKIEVLDSISFYPSDTIRVTVSKDMGDWRLSRQYMFRLTPGSRVPIQQIGY
jgi:type II secretory pathway component PulK